MGLVSNIRRELRDDDAGMLANPPSWLRNWLFGVDMPAASGVNVNHETAVRLVAVFACVRDISESIAMLPLPLYKRLKVGKEKATSHPLYSILHDSPNPEITSFQFRQIMMVNALLMPNAYAEIEYNGAGQIIALWPIPSNCVQIKRDSKHRRYFQVSTSTGMTDVDDDHMFMLPGMGFDADHAFVPMQLAREAIGLGLATEGMGARFFGNGANATGIVEYPEAMSDEAYTRFKDSFNQKFTGLSNAQRVMFLEQGLKFTQLTIPPEAAQFIETRKFQVVEIARFFNVPPHRIMHLEQATFSNIEHQGLEYVTYCLMPWLVKWEQETYRSLLLTPADKKKYFAKFTVDALLRGDFKTRMDGYHQMIQDGVYSADEVRELEEMNPQPDGQGAIYFINGTMKPKKVAAEPEKDPKPKGGSNEPSKQSPDPAEPAGGDPNDPGEGGASGVE